MDLFIVLGRILYPIKETFLRKAVPSGCASDGCCKDPLDNDNSLIFKQFQQAGYKTLWSDDWSAGIFNLNGIRCTGFTKAPVDHYMRYERGTQN